MLKLCRMDQSLLLPHEIHTEMLLLSIYERYYLLIKGIIYVLEVLSLYMRGIIYVLEVLSVCMRCIIYILEVSHRCRCELPCLLEQEISINTTLFLTFDL